MKTKYITDYLNSNFPTTSTDWTPADVVSRFITEFGVDAKPEAHTDGKTIFLFKYDMLGAKWNFPITHECRGIILRNSVEGWEVMSYPFNKFFNQHEGSCPIFQEKEFNARIHELSFVEKCDGTFCNVWFDNFKNEWRVSTLGSITPLNVGDYDMTFTDLFWKILGDKTKLNNIHKHINLFFELCTVYNRVVTRYPTDRLYLIGGRNLITGELIPI